MGSKRFFGFQWHITNFCNLRCRHCYQNDFTRKDDLNIGEIKKIIEKITKGLSDSNILVNLTGGEPLLYKDIFEVLNILDNIENIIQINIITNGLPLNKEMNRCLNSYKKIKEIKISLEGGSEETNDSIRGRGNFKRVIKNLEICTLQSNKEVILMFTLGSYNYKEISSMFELARNLGVQGVIIERFVPLGNGLKMKDKFLKPDEWQNVIEAIIEYLKLELTPQDLLPYKAFHIEFKNEMEIKGALCNLGDESMALMPNGDVYPCRRFPTRIGNLLKEQFSEISLRLKVLKESLAKNLKGKCFNCRIYNCIGCRAMGYSVSGDFYSEDPQCFL